MSDKNNEVEVILDTDYEDGPWEEDPKVKHSIAEIIDSCGKTFVIPDAQRGGFQVAYVSPFAGHVLGNAIQSPIIRAELIQDSLRQRGDTPESILREVAQLREDLWRIGQSYCIRENFEKNKEFCDD